MNKKFCTSCGAELVPSAKFCSQCGADSGEIEAQSSVAPQPSAHEPSATSPTSGSISQTTNAQPDQSNEEGCFGSIVTMLSGAIGCGCAVILIVGGLIALIIGLSA